MTTTCVRDSIVGDQWIQMTAQQIPIQKVINPDTGQFEGDIQCGPVRLSFFQNSLFELPKPMTNSKGEAQGEPKYGSHLLFTPYANPQVLYDEYYRMCGIEFPEYYQGGQYVGLESPFKDQALKAAKYAGYTPGCFFLNSTSLFRPQVVDARRNPIVDKDRVYPGMWALPTVRAYASGKKDKMFKKGIQFGLQSVMIIGDDEKFGSAGPDAQKLYAGINVAPPPISAAQAARAPQGPPAGAPPFNPGAPPPAAGIPGYIAPGGAAMRPGMMPGAPAPAVPQQHWTPPGVPPAPLAAGYPQNPAYAAPGYPPAPPGIAAATTYASSTPCFCGSGRLENQCCSIPF